MVDNSNDLIYQSLTRYFKVLEKTGYLKDSDLNKMLLFIFLQEFIAEFRECMCGRDYKYLLDILQCLLSSSCVLPNDGYGISTLLRVSCRH